MSAGIQHDNDNIASSSRITTGGNAGQSAVNRGRSESRTKGKGRETAANHVDKDSRLTSPPPHGVRRGSDRGGDVSLRTLSPGSARENGGSTARRVRTVPPSAIYDPPTPPSPVHSPHPHPNPGLSSSSAGVISPRRPRQRLRYSSSSDSSADTDDADDSDDDEPPWWTFTQRGMAKLRAKSMHRSGRDLEQGTGVDVPAGGADGEESGKEDASTTPHNRRRISTAFLPSSRRSSRDKEGMGSAPSSIKNFMSGQRQNTDSPSSLTPGKLLQPAPIRFSNTTQNLFRRSIIRHDSPPIMEGVVHAGLGGGGAPGMQRTKSAPTRPASAPTSPTVEAPSPGMTTLVDDRSSRFPSNESNPPKLSMDGVEPSNSNYKRVVRRQLTSPNFPRFFRRNDSEDEPMEALTDTEVIHATRDKSKGRSTLSRPVAIPGGISRSSSSGGINTSNPHIAGDATPDAGGDSTPTRPRTKRRATHMLRLNLPPPISQHFANGWPHAGSWQDALYGYYGEEPGSIPPSKSRSRKSTKNDSESPALPPTKANASGTNNDDDPITPQRPEFNFTGPSDEMTPTTAATGLTNGTIGTAGTSQSDGGDTTKRTKSRRQRRYRPAMVPPTPSGLGFTPRTREGGEPSEYPWAEGSSQQDDNAHPLEKQGGFDWQTAIAQKELATSNGHREGQDQHDLARHDTIATQTGTHTSADSEQGRRRRGWWSLGSGERRRKTKSEKMSRRKVDSDWRRRYRRMLFLDARVTIWLRLVNLAVVVVLLGLAVTIRLELDDLRLPGLIGSSTTMNICYATLTIVHVMTAIYREYFGKPIGLWGLRSKMLWVCLDLLFVGLWSSAITLSTNDLIATPLECTSGNAWWRMGLADEYAELLDDLKLLAGSNSTSSVAESVTHASHSITISLPQMVISSPVAREACRRQAGCIALSLLALLLYGGNMVLSLFRIFETVRRTANVRQAVTF